MCLFGRVGRNNATSTHGTIQDKDGRRKGMGVKKPKSCIECVQADCTGYCKILNDRQEDYALKRHKKCPIGEEKYEQEEKEK